jgi:hypothetical protein
MQCGQKADSYQFIYKNAASPGTQVDTFLDTSSALSKGGEVEGVCTSLDAYLQWRTFLVGYTLTAADCVMWGGITGGEGCCTEFSGWQNLHQCRNTFLLGDLLI